MAGKRVVIIGGGGAGDAAAFALRKKGFPGEIVILSADGNRPYDRPYLSKEYLRGEVELSKVFLHDEGEYAKQAIELQLSRRVIDGSLSERKLRLEDGEVVAFVALDLVLEGTPRRLPDAPAPENVLQHGSLSERQAITRA